MGGQKVPPYLSQPILSGSILWQLQLALLPVSLLDKPPPNQDVHSYCSRKEATGLSWILSLHQQSQLWDAKEKKVFGNSHVTQGLDLIQTPQPRCQSGTINKKFERKNVISIRLNPDYVLRSNFIRHIGPQAHKLFKFIVTASNGESKTSQ